MQVKYFFRNKPSTLPCGGQVFWLQQTKHFVTIRPSINFVSCGTSIWSSADQALCLVHVKYFAYNRPCILSSPAKHIICLVQAKHLALCIPKIFPITYFTIQRAKQFALYLPPSILSMSHQAQTSLVHTDHFVAIKPGTSSIADQVFCHQQAKHLTLSMLTIFPRACQIFCYQPAKHKLASCRPSILSQSSHQSSIMAKQFDKILCIWLIVGHGHSVHRQRNVLPLAPAEQIFCLQ